MIDRSFSYEGKRYRIRAATEEEYFQKKANKIRDIDEGRIILTSTMLVKDWVEVCLDTYKVNVKDETLRDMKHRIHKHIVEPLGCYTVKQIKPLHCQQIMSAQEGMSQSHIDKLYQELHFIFEMAVANEMILKNPAEKITKPRGTKGTHRSITDFERKHLLLVADQDPRFNYFLFMLYCGCRPGEAVEILGNDISEIDGRMMLHIRGTKTKNSDRYVPIRDELLKRIHPKPFEYVNQNKNGKRIDESSYKRLVKALNRAMNISMGCKVYRNELIPPYPLSEDFVPYCLRHTYCTDLCKAGVDVRVAQKLMGHSSISITADIYTHVNMSQLADAGILLDNYLSAEGF